MRTRSDRAAIQAQREARERENKAACQRDCTAQSLIAATREARARGDALAGYSPWYVGEGKKGGMFWCDKHHLYVLLEWDVPPTGGAKDASE